MNKLLTILLLLLLPCNVFASDILIGAGVGLKDVLNELSGAYSAKNSRVSISKSLLVSGALAKQMDNGLKVDIVFVANREWIDYMKGKNHLDAATITPFAYNTLVLLGSPHHGSNGAVKEIHDIVRLNRIALGSPKSVPAGDYAMHAIKKAGIEQALEKKLVMARDVRDCMMYAERGEVDGAFVYKTDAMMAKRAKVLFTVPSDLYPRVVYMMAITTTGAKKSEVVSYFNFLKSAEARKILKKHGFETR